MTSTLDLVSTVDTRSTSGVTVKELGEDAVEADELSEATKDVARARYQRLFWEPVVEGKVCTVSSVHECQS